MLRMYLLRHLLEEHGIGRLFFSVCRLLIKRPPNLLPSPEAGMKRVVYLLCSPELGVGGPLLPADVDALGGIVDIIAAPVFGPDPLIFV